MPSPAPEATAGRTLVVRLTEDVSTATTREGAPVHAVVASPLVDDEGHVLVPEGAYVDGRVRRSETGHGATTPKLELVFHRVRFGQHDLRIHGEVAAADIEIEGSSPGQPRDPVVHGWSGATVGVMMLGGVPGAMFGSALAGVGGIVSTVRSRVAVARLPVGSFLTLHLLPTEKKKPPS